MSSNQDTKTTTTASQPQAAAEIKPTNTTVIQDNKSPCEQKGCDPKACCKNTPTTENKSCVRTFFKSYLFYFLFTSGSVVSSYFLWRKYGRKH